MTLRGNDQVEQVTTLMTVMETGKLHVEPLSSGLSVAASARDGDIHLYRIEWATYSCSLSRCGCALVLLISHEQRL